MMEDRLEGAQPNPQPAASPLAPGLPSAPAAPPSARRPFSPVVRDEGGPDGGGEHGEAPRRRPSIVIVNRDDEEDRDEGALKEMLELYEDSMKNLEEGEILKGRVLRVNKNEVVVDIGFKSEGIIPLEEFADADSVKVGDEVDVFLEKMENQDGLVVLSKQRADFVKVWDRVREAAEKGEVVEGRLARKIKGGAVVDLFGVDAFLPGSQIALRPPQSIESLMHQILQFKIIKLNKRRRNIVVSRRLVLEEERASAKEDILRTLEVGQLRAGYVKNITDFGAFIDLGGIDGLLHITDISYGRIKHPSEVLTVGDKLDVKVLSFEPERERISLGLKQLQEYPWERVEDKYPIGTRIQGRVVSITEYGAFVELERGVEGLIHISEMSWTKHIRHPNKILTEGQDVDCMVLKVDKGNEKISLGLKQVEPDPWLTLDEKYPLGLVISGKVRNLTNFGAFVELEDGIDGLVHISDMSWMRRINHPSEVLKKGQQVNVKVLSVDKDKRRISLGLKQVGDDPWPQLLDRYPINSVVQALVSKAIDRGVVVVVENELEGFVPIGQLGIDTVKHPGENFIEGDELSCQVSRIDLANHRMVLSVKGWLLEQDEATRQAYVEKYSAKRATVTEGGEEEVRPRAKSRRSEEDGDDEANGVDPGSDDSGLDEIASDDIAPDEIDSDEVGSDEVGSGDIDAEAIRPHDAGSGDIGS
jgi:small subunit ribosomal protein S1